MMPLRRALARLRVRLAAARVARAGSLREVQRFAMRLHAARPALVTPTVAWDWVELGDQVLRLAAAWRAAGIGKGARVATLLSDEWPQLVVRLAGIETGVVLVGFTPAHPPAVLAQALRELAPALLMAEPALLPADFDPQGVLLWDCTPGAGTLQARLAATAPAASREPLQREDLIGIGYTSGTSGAPKLLAIRHASYLHSLRLLLLNLSDPPRERSRMLVGVPLSGAGSGAVLPAVLSGGQLILPPRYDADALLEALRERRPSHLFTTPSLLIDLLDHPGLGDDDLSGVQVIYGTAAMPVAKLREAISRFGRIFQQGYGMAEALPPVAMLAPAEHVDDGRPAWASVLSSSGRIARGVELEVRGEAGDKLATGAIGRVWVRSPTVFEGYMDRQALGHEVLHKGWYFTGDHGWFDDAGRIHILDRQQNLIDLPQGRLYPRLVEEVAHECRHVKEAALVQARGQVWLCVSLRRASRGLPVATVQDELAAQLASFLPDWQRPGHLLIVDELPRSFLAKLLHREVRASIERGELGCPA